MSSRRFAIACAAALCLAVPTVSHAFQFTGVGAKLGYVNPEDLDGSVMLGAHLDFDHPNGLRLQPSLNYWDSDVVSDVSPNLDLSYRFMGGGGVTPYLGAGLGMHMYNSDNSSFSDTNLGMNLFGGVSFPGSRTDVFLEARHSTSDITQTALLGGVTLRIR
jgi:hypothetical protein